MEDGQALPRFDEAEPEWAGTVLVPVSSFETAPALLAVAGALTDPDGGRVVALVVVSGDEEAEEHASFLGEMRDLVESTAWVPGVAFELMTRTAPTMARGILDAANEIGSDLVVLGVVQERRGEAMAGPVAEGVMSTATVDTVFVRFPVRGPDLSGLRRIVLLVDGSVQSRFAARVGILLAASMGLRAHAVHVAGGEVPRAIGFGTIERSLEGIPGREQCTSELVVAGDLAQGVMSLVESTDLIVMGSHETGHLRDWVSGSSSAQLLRHAPGPVVTVAGRAGSRAWSGLLGRIRPKLTKVEQDTVVWQSERLARVSLDYVVLIVVSGLLASFGLMQDSAAVVIGAMLVAPLLGPLTAVSVGLVTARLVLAERAGFTVVVGALLAVACGVLLGLVIPLESPTAEMLARGSPTLLDAGVALAAGAVGAYATARKEIPAALAGVAIAAALVPPLCTIGLAVALGELELARGAALLFSTNVISVAVLGGVVFWWFGMRAVVTGGRERRRVLSWVILGVLSLVTVVALLNVGQQARRAVIAERDLQEEFEDADLVDLVYEESDPVQVVATLRSERDITPAEVAAAEAGVRDRLGIEITLDIVVQKVVRSGS